jgi:acetyl esterase/lipase
LDSYVTSQGPFDAVMGFSAGAVLAGLYLLDKHQRDETLPFRGAVLLSAGSSAAALESLGVGGGCRRIPIPSAHIWGSADDMAPDGGRDLSRLFEPSCRLNLIHDGGHEIPRKSYVTESVHIIRRVLALASEG